MKKRDYFFFLGWLIALAVATFIWCLVGELLHSTSQTLHIISGVLCALGALGALIIGIIYRIKRKNIVDE